MSKANRGRVRDPDGLAYVVIGETESKDNVECVPDYEPTLTLALPISQLSWLSTEPDWVSICCLPTRSNSR